MTGDVVTDIDIKNGDVIAYQKQSLPPQRKNNSHIYKSKAYNVKKYIHYGDWIILMKYGKALMYMTLQGYNNWDIESISHIIITWDHT